ncbi:MAG TPA: hypothetical protein VM941_02170 [Pyrinomonadaceae bacterium]|nr:hypothetical protein [Pyrinomonadaceae bacterium]
MKYTLFLLIFVLGTSIAFAQGTPAAPAPTDIAGSYEGTTKGKPVTLEVKTVAGKLGGQLKTADKSYELTEGAVNAEGLLSLTFGKDAKLEGKTDGAKISGNLIVGTEKSPIELKKLQAAAAPATPATAAPAPVNLSGQWEAVADANGQPFPFLLTLKVEGESVTGSSSSQLGEAAIKDGSWRDGKLAFTLAGSNGDIVMAATVVDGKLTGEFDYSGQLQGKWVAVRKN